MKTPITKTRKYIELMLYGAGQNIPTLEWRLIELRRVLPGQKHKRFIKITESEIEDVKAALERAKAEVAQWKEFLEQFDKAFN